MRVGGEDSGLASSSLLEHHHPGLEEKFDREEAVGHKKESWKELRGAISPAQERCINRRNRRSVLAPRRCRKPPRTTNICQAGGVRLILTAIVFRLNVLQVSQDVEIRRSRPSVKRVCGTRKKRKSPGVWSKATRCGMCVSRCPLATQPPALTSRLSSHVVVFIGLMLQIFFFSRYPALFGSEGFLTRRWLAFERQGFQQKKTKQNKRKQAHAQAQQE